MVLLLHQSEAKQTHSLSSSWLGACVGGQSCFMPGAHKNIRAMMQIFFTEKENKIISYNTDFILFHLYILQKQTKNLYISFVC